MNVTPPAMRVCGSGPTYKGISAAGRPSLSTPPYATRSGSGSCQRIPWSLKRTSCMSGGSGASICVRDTPASDRALKMSRSINDA